MLRPILFKIIFILKEEFVLTNEIKIFENPEFGKVRTTLIDGEPYFIGKDVAQILGYGNPRQALKSNVDDEDKGVHSMDTLGGKQSVTVISESGLYSLILGSKLPKAKEFKRWVTSEILPSIRKHGAYMTDETLEKALLSPDFLIQLATELKKEKEMRIAAENKIKADEPKVAFAEKVADSSSLIDIGMLSKLAQDERINIGRNRLFAWLRENEFLQSSDYHKNEPYQKYINQGIFEVKEYTYTTPYGEKCGTKTYVTGKGQIYIIEKLRKYFVK